MSSGASVAPPERFRSLAVTTTPSVSTRSTHQCRSDVQSASSSKVTIPEEDVDEGEDEGDEDEDEDEDKEEDEDEDEEGDGDGDEDEDEDGDENKDGDEDEDEDEKDSGEDKGNEDQSNKGDESGEGKQDEQNEDKEEQVGQSEEDGQGTNKKGKGNESIRNVDNEAGQRGRPMTPKAVAGDIQMLSPQNSPPALHGSSRTSGGLFRGQAAGNALNAADWSNSGNNDYIGPVHGQINIYLSQNDPATLSPTSLVPYARLSYDYAAKTPIAPVLERVARRYSPVRRE